MHEPLLQSVYDFFLYGVPVVGLLLFSIFKLDALISAPKKRLRRRPAVAGTRADGEPLGCDPDGRLWPAQRRRLRFLPDHTEEISQSIPSKARCRNAGGAENFL